MPFETKRYTDGTSASGEGPLPDYSQDQQDIRHALMLARAFVEWPTISAAIDRALVASTLAISAPPVDQ